MLRPTLMSLTSCALALAATLLLSYDAAASESAGAARHYGVRQQWNLGAPTRWDYVALDPVRHRLYVTRGQYVQVLDPDSGREIGTVQGLKGVHGVAFAQDLKLGFASNGQANTVTVFDLDTLQVKREVDVGGVNPDALLYVAGTHRLYTFNGKSGDVSVFDAPDMRLLTRIPVGGKLEFAADDDAGHVFVNVEDKGEIVEIDGRTDKVMAHWPLSGCEEPSGLALDAAHRRLFSVCANHVLAVTDSVSGKAVARVAIGGGPDATAYDPASGTVFSSNGEGTLTVIRQLDADRYEVAATVPTRKGARTMAVDGASGRIYLPAADKQQFGVTVVGAQ